MRLYDFERSLNITRESSGTRLTDSEINEKYENGETRIVTEQGSIKLSLVKNVFGGDNYDLQPKYQRRIVWDNVKRSKLIESFIMNIPVPPIFIYEIDFDKYQVMDGLQRVTAIMDFYNDGYELTQLSQWPELNGKKYSQLPQKIKEGIDRRQLSVITLLKESSRSPQKEEEMKKMVFERLNTGGVKLSDQEIRNATLNGPFNSLCIDLSINSVFRKLWGFELIEDTGNNEDTVEEYEDIVLYENKKNFIRMQDVELILRYFSMRHIEEYFGPLNEFLDICLSSGNEYQSEDLATLKQLFIDVINNAFSLFGDKAFCSYNNEKWSSPKKMIYDPMMLALSEIRLNTNLVNKNQNIIELKNFYRTSHDLFNGKKQGKNDIKERRDRLLAFIKDLSGVINE